MNLDERFRFIYLYHILISSKWRDLSPTKYGLYMPIHLPIYLSVHQSLYLSAYLSTFLYSCQLKERSTYFSINVIYIYTQTYTCLHIHVLQYSERKDIKIKIQRNKSIPQGQETKTKHEIVR